MTIVITILHIIALVLAILVLIFMAWGCLLECLKTKRLLPEELAKDIKELRDTVKHNNEVSNCRYEELCNCINSVDDYHSNESYRIIAKLNKLQDATNEQFRQHFKVEDKPKTKE